MKDDTSKQNLTQQRDNWPRPLGNDAYRTLAGAVVELIAPSTEADHAYLLISFLMMFGSVIGRSAYFTVEETRHYANEFALFVGYTGEARKGTAQDRMNALFRECAKISTRNITLGQRWSGLSTGEGLIAALADPKPTAEAPNPPPIEKRVLVIEPKFARVLTVMSRADNILSMILRQSWDSGHLEKRTLRDTMEATDVHLSIIGHITPDELRRKLTETERANGFGNRFLFAMVTRSQLKPRGDDAIRYPNELLEELLLSIEFASKTTLMKHSEAFWALWEGEYKRLARRRVGLSGELLSRDVAHIRRLAMIYALLDQSTTIGEKHLRAALAVWRYCEDSVKFVFGDALGDPVADAIINALREHGGEMRRRDIMDYF
jgi:hypothetical protein